MDQTPETDWRKVAATLADALEDSLAKADTAKKGNSAMTFIVSCGDGESYWPIAVYEDCELARKHAEWIGGDVTELSMSATLPQGVGDPAEVGTPRRSAESEGKRGSSVNLIHDFHPCDPQCKQQGEHCGYEWCGAPRNHPLHAGYQGDSGPLTDPGASDAKARTT